MSSEYEDNFEIIVDNQININDSSERIIETFDNAEDLFPLEDNSSEESWFSTKFNFLNEKRLLNILCQCSDRRNPIRR